MYKPSEDWSPLQAQMRQALQKPQGFEEGMAICRRLHAMVHRGAVTGAETPTLADMVAQGLATGDYAVMPTKRDVTIAWDVWHITRIEDLTMNLLVADADQVFAAGWQRRLNAPAIDTGNAMTDEEIIDLSEKLDADALWAYRDAVARRSRAILDTLAPADMDRKFQPQQAQRIVDEGGLTQHPDSICLRDFWGKKTVRGILLLPLTRHQAGHLNDCLNLRKKIAAKAKRKQAPDT